MEMMNEQPMVDATLLSLVHVTDTDLGQGLGRFMDTGDSPTSSRMEVHSPTLRNPMRKSGFQGSLKDKVVAFDSGPDMMVGQMDELKAIFKELETDPGRDKQGLAVMERDISLISSDPPPTWSMLQEAEMLKTCNPKIMPSNRTPSKQKELIKAPPPPPMLVKTSLLAEKQAMLGPTPLSLTKLTTTLESFKPRPTMFNARGKGKPFVMTTGTGKEPSSVGMDDTMKSLSELKLEIDNRRAWEKKAMISSTGVSDKTSSALQLQQQQY